MCIKSFKSPLPISLVQWISYIIVHKPSRAKLVYVSNTTQDGLPRPLGVQTSVKITSQSSRVWSNDHFILGCSSALNVIPRLATLYQPLRMSLDHHLQALRYVGGIPFVFFVLKLLPVRVTQRNSCCISNSMMKYQLKFPLIQLW